MKSTLMTLVSLSFSVLLAGACTVESTGSSPGGDLSLLSNGPNLPEECNPCWDQFQECFAEGNGLEQCAQQIVECVESCEAPPPPPECLHCAAGFDACATTAQDNGDSGEDCAVGFEGCLSACEGDSFCEQEPDACEPPPVDECDACQMHFDECINEEWQNGGQPGDQGDGDTAHCEEMFDQCNQGCQPVEPDPQEPCSEVEQLCQGNEDGEIQLPDGDVISCADAWQICQGEQPDEPQPDPSECDQCEDLMQQCEGNQDGEDCQQVHEYCGQVCN